MPSNSLVRWQNRRAADLDEIEHAHLRVGGTARGRRYATLQINHAYCALLSSQFQGFCRDLHSECIDHVVATTPTALQTLLRIEFLWNRTLDRGNPNPGNTGQDFNRLGIQFWPAVLAMRASNKRRQELLQELVSWRNAIAHQDFDSVGGSAALHLSQVRAWRRAAAALAEDFDLVMYNHLVMLLGTAPW